MRPRKLTQALCAGAVAITVALVQVHCGHGDGGAPGAISDAGPEGHAPLRDAKPPLGNQVPDANVDPLQGCATATAAIDRAPVYVLIVLDGSGSMASESKWAAVVPAFDYFIDDLAKKGDRSFGLGLTVFSDQQDLTDGGGPYPKMDVPVAFVDLTQASALHARLDTTRPSNNTPTLAVLTGQYAAMEAYTPAAPLIPGGKRFVVLITDGAPFPDPDTQKPLCIKAAGDEFAKVAPEGPITTFAVGVGELFPYDPQIYDQIFMGELAKAGGAPNDPCTADEQINIANMCHFQIVPSYGQNPLLLEQAFLSAIDKIRSRVTSCDLTLEETDAGFVDLDPSQVNVRFTASVTGESTVIPEDPGDGWTYDDPHSPKKVVLHGEACTLLTDDPDGVIQVVLGCKTIVK